LPTVDITTTATRVVPPNKKRTSLLINSLAGNEAIGLIDNPTLTYNEKSVQITGGQNYAISLGSAIVGYENDGTPIYDNQRWVTGAWWLISSTGTQTISYQEIFR